MDEIGCFFLPQISTNFNKLFLLNLVESVWAAHTDPTLAEFARLTWNLTEDYDCSWKTIQSDFHTYFIHLNPIYTDFKKVKKSTSQQVNEQ